jgi:hypothetical protein
MTKRFAYKAAAVTAAMLSMATGCSPQSHTVGELDGAVETDAGSSIMPDGAVGVDAASNIVLDKSKADVLFVIDNSGSMAQEQASLITAIPSIARSLVTNDVLGNDNPDDPSTLDDNTSIFRDVHMGVVTTDLGTANSAIQTCNLQPIGEAGALRGRGFGAGCPDVLPEFVTVSSIDDVESAVTNLSCLANVGTTGCGFEQPLESMLMALTPSTSTLRFAGGLLGSADTLNEGFVRSDSVLIVILLTDEEDCSFFDSRLVDGSDPTVDGTNLNLRCVLFPQLLHPTTRYVDGLRALRPGRPDSVIFGAITGVPTDLVPESGETPDYGAILADARLEQTIDPENPNGFAPSCEDPDRGRADPPRRIVETARGFGENGFLASICQADYSSVASYIAARVEAIRERP